MDSLFPLDEMVPWRKEWQDMPEYELRDVAPRFQLIVNFACVGDVQDFAKAIGQTIEVNEQRRQLPSLWFPDQEIGYVINKRYIRRA